MDRAICYRKSMKNVIRDKSSCLEDKIKDPPVLMF